MKFMGFCNFNWNFFIKFTVYLNIKLSLHESIWIDVSFQSLTGLPQVYTMWKNFYVLIEPQNNKRIPNTNIQQIYVSLQM